MKRKIPFLLTLLALILVLAGCFLIPAQLKPPHLVFPSNGQKNVKPTVTLKWTDPNTSLDTYKVYFGTEENPPFYETATLTSITLKNLKYSTTYYWKVSAFNGLTTATSETWKFTVQAPPYPSTPILTVSAKSTDSVTLAWKTSNASDVILYEGGNTSYSEIESFTSNNGDYTVNGLTPSTTYSFYVVAENAYGSVKSNIVTVTTNDVEQTSTFSIYITDKPMSPSQASAVYVSISDVSVNLTSNGTSTWKEMMKKPHECDLMDLVGNTMMLSSENLPSSSMITQIDVKISGATVVVHGKSYRAKMLKNEVKINMKPFKVSESTSVYLDFDLSTSMQCMGEGKYEFSPTIKAVCEKNRAELKGRLEYEGLGVKNAIVSLITSDSTVSQTFSKKEGYFNFAAVPAGEYVLEIEAEGFSPYSTLVYLKKGMNDIGIIDMTALLNSATSSFSLYLTDDPISPANVSAVYVTISKVSLRTATGTWYNVFSTPLTYNVLDLMGTSVSMASTPLPASAVIDRISMEITSATVVVGTQTFTVEIPHKTFSMNLTSFKISNEKSLYLDFNLSESVVYVHREYMLIPHLRAVCGSQRALLRGIVLFNGHPAENASVSLSTSATIVSKTYTKHNGEFTFAAVQSGSYTLSVSISGVSTYSTSVMLHRGMNFIGDIEINASPSALPASPVITSLTSNQNRVSLQWEESSTNVSDFEILRKAASNTYFTIIVELPFKTRKYVDTVSLPGTYCYAVVAKNEYGGATSTFKCVDVKFAH